MSWTEVGLAIGALVGIVTLVSSVWAGYRALRKQVYAQVKAEAILEEAQTTVQKLKQEGEVKDATIQAQGEKIAEYRAMLRLATRQEEQS